MTFKQLDITLTRYHYLIETNGISITRKTLFSTNKQFIPFEEVGSQILRTRERKLVWLFTSLLFFSFAILVFIRRMNGGRVGNGAEVFWLFIAIIFFIVYALKRKHSLLLIKENETGGIEFIGTKIYRRSVDNFIKELLQRRDTYFINKYPPYNGLTLNENIICTNAGLKLLDGLLLKTLTKNAIEKLSFYSAHTQPFKHTGIKSITTKKNARKILKEQLDKFISEGKYIFISEFLNNKYYIALVGSTSDPYEIIAEVGTNGANYDIDTIDIITKYKKWDKEFGIRPVGIGTDFCECEIINKNIGYKELAEEIYEFCPDVVDQGTGSIELLEDEIKQTGRIFLWWD